MIKKILFCFLSLVVVSHPINAQTISVATNDRNPFIHAFSVHGLPSISADDTSQEIPYFEIITLYGDGQFHKDSIFPGPKDKLQYQFSSPINYVNHLYPSSSNYRFVAILKGINCDTPDEIIISGLTNPDIDLKDDFGMCNPMPKESLNTNKKITINSLSPVTDKTTYIALVISFLSHDRSSQIILDYNHDDYQHIEQVIPNIVGAINLDLSNQSPDNELVSGKIKYDINRIPRISKDEPFEIRIAEIFKLKTNRLSSIKATYMENNNQIIAIDSIVPNETNYWQSGELNNTNNDSEKQESKSPRRKRFSEMSIFELIANNWTVILVGLLTIGLLIYLIRKYKPQW